MHQFSYSAPHISLTQLSKKYGPIMAMRLGSIPTVVVSSAKTAQDVLKTQDHSFCGRPALRGQQKLSYNGLDMAFSPYNEYWKEMRKLCTLHLLGPRQVQSFRPIREDEVSQMIERVSELAKTSEVANMSEIILTLSSSIISRVAFGKRYGEEWFGRDKFDRFFTETEAMFACFFVSDYFPLLGWIDKITGLGGRLDKDFKDLDVFYQQLIDEHLNPDLRSSSKFAREEDIIDILLRLKNDQNLSSSFDLTSDHIKGVLMNIFIGGTDTNTSTIIWVMTALMQNPTAMKKAQEEIRNLVGKKGKVDEDDLPNLPYLKAVVKEAMRLYPPSPLLIPRETLENCIIGDGIHQYEIKSKTLVYVNFWAISRDPECWENPDEFLPERFLTGRNIDFRGQDFELIPFGAGRRGCPGISMGIATVELTLSNLLYTFDWELPDGMRKEDIDTDSLPGLTFQRKNKLCLVPKLHAYS